MKKFYKIYSIKNLKTKINKYGFNYSTKDFLIENLIILSLVFVVAFLSKLQLTYILILILIALLTIPFLIHAWFIQSYNIKKFGMVADYLTNIIPIFTQKTKIRYTLGELYTMTSGQMKEAIKRAIDYLDTTLDDSKASENALRIIEQEFNNSRIKSVHKLLITIEAQNSKDYSEVCANMYEDIENFIKRVYGFQKSLKNRRKKLIILCLVTLFMNSMFVFLYVSNEAFIGFTDNVIYQVSTSIFIASILITITLILTKLHGEWLINDTKYSDDQKLEKAYTIYKKGKQKLGVIDIIFGLLGLACTIYLFVIKQYLFMLLTFVISLLIFFNKTRIFNNAYKTLHKSFTIEFPIWLREISLNLSNLTVLNAVEYSQNMASYPMRKELRDFIDKSKKDPTSIKPYNDFLADFDLEDARSSMKVLYSIQNVGKIDVKNRISNLIIRNQEMLDRAESIRNNDSIGYVEAIGYVPVLLFSGQMLVSMFTMFTFMMDLISRSINL